MKISWPAEEQVVNFSQDLDEAGLTDSGLASGLAFIAMKATKTMSLWMWETLEVPDYLTRLNAIKIALKAKGHLAEKSTWADKAKKHIKYIIQ